jgi:metal-responsive CopG/Arc/MetJ family transcriptional regulator
MMAPVSVSLDETILSLLDSLVQSEGINRSSFFRRLIFNEVRWLTRVKTTQSSTMASAANQHRGESGHKLIEIEQ